MQYSTFLKKQAIAFIDIYKSQFTKTITSAFLWTILCFVIIQVLANYSHYDFITIKHPVSILSFFFNRFSSDEVYCIADNGKSVFLFFVSVFSIGLLDKVTPKSVLYLLIAFAGCVLLDFFFFRLNAQAHHAAYNYDLSKWLSEILFLCRLYIPLLLFAIMIRICISTQPINTKQIIFLLIAVFFFNEVAYEVMLLVRTSIFELITTTVKSKPSFYWVESALSTILIASFFLGYYCAMTAPFTLTAAAEQEVEKEKEE